MYLPTRALVSSLSFVLLTTLACSDDGSGSTSDAEMGTSTGDGDGDGSSGDGDGDGSTGDGDGDGSTGDGDGDGSTGDGDGDGSTGDGDGDGGGAPCSMDMPCGEDEYCDYGGSCGIFGQPGTCMAMPEGCDAGGPGACGCDGSIATNACEIRWTGSDWFEYGGCTIGEAGTFACGDATCDVATEFCGISFNDVGGEGEPEYFANCQALPDDCEQGDCGCISPDLTCYAGTGNAVVFYPGG